MRRIVLPGLLAGAILTPLLLGGCADQPGMANPDLTMRVSRKVWSKDHYVSEGENLMTVSPRFLARGKRVKTGYADPTTKEVVAASAPLGSYVANDSNDQDEYLIVRGANNNPILTLRQRELNKINLLKLSQRHEEGLSATFKTETEPLASIAELEETWASTSVETVRYHQTSADGVVNQQGIAQVTERFNPVFGESWRHGTTIKVQDEGAERVITTEMKRFSNFAPLGSNVSLDGKHIYTIKWVKGKMGKNLVFKGFSFQTPEGKEFARMQLADEFALYQTGYAFYENRDGVDALLGTMYVKRDSTKHGESGPTTHLDHMDFHFAGTNPADKRASMERINKIMALAPDQVNKDDYRLHDFEEYLDAARAAIHGSGKARGDAQMQRIAIDLAQEEDGTTILPAIKALVPGAR